MQSMCVSAGSSIVVHVVVVVSNWLQSQTEGGNNMTTVTMFPSLRNFILMLPVFLSSHCLIFNYLIRKGLFTFFFKRQGKKPQFQSDSLLTLLCV